MAFCLALVGCVAAPVTAQDAATLAPAGTTTYIQINHPAALRAEFENDPFLKSLFHSGHRPAEADQAWQQIEAALGLTRQQILERYFGQRVMFLSAGNREQGVVVSSVSPQDAAHAISSLRLQKLGDSGAMTIHKTPDEQGRVAFGKSLMVLGRAEQGFFDVVLHTIAGQSAALADEAEFRQWSAALGQTQTDAFLFHRDTSTQEFHVASLRRIGRDLALEYAGTSGPARAVLSHTAGAEALDFGPLPASVIAAVSVNLYSEAVDPRVGERIDRLIAPRSLARDIVPRLEAPWLLALGEVAAHNRDGVGATPLPAIAIAVRLRDPAVTTDLDALLSALVGAANVIAAARNAEPIVTRTVGEGEAAYQVADLGGPIARRFGKPELADLLQVTYGRVGDWYVLASHESFFTQCRQAAEARAEHRLPEHLIRPVRPVLTAVADGPRLALHLRAFASRVGSDHPETQDVRRLVWLAQFLSQCRGGTTVQAWKADETTLRATVRVRREATAGSTSGVGSDLGRGQRPGE